MRPKWFLVVLAVGGALWAGAVAAGAQSADPATPATNAAPDASLEALKERVALYWNARVKRDYRTQYELLEPRARARTSPEEYGRGRMVRYEAAQVEDAERRGNFARVTVRVLVRVVHPLLGGSRIETSLLQDHWVLIGGTWYRSQEADTGNTPPWPAAPGSP